MSLSKQMVTIAEQMGLGFTFKSSPISLDEVFSFTGLMPGLAKRADQLAQLTLGYGLGVTFEEDESLLLGKKCKFDEYTPESLRLLCLVDSLLEITKNHPDQSSIPLDELLYD